MNTLYCVMCNGRTPRNFAAEHVFNGVYCERCAKILTRPPNVGSSVQNREARWQLNIGSLAAGAFGDPEDPATLLLYWKAQEAAGYPDASENVRYFKELTLRANSERTGTLEARWKGAGLGDYYCSLCQHTISGRTKFCPECGAKMDEWEEDEV